MRIALIQCPAFGIDRPPLALGYLAAFVRRHGFVTKVFDLNINLYFQAKDEDRKFWEFKYVDKWITGDIFLKEKFIPEDFFKDWAKEILVSDPEIIGFSVHCTSLAASINLAREIKRINPNKIIVFGGPLYFSYNIPEYACGLAQKGDDSGFTVVDIIVIGEGEETFLDLLQRLKNNIPLESCPGIVYKKDNRIINNGLRLLMGNLDTLPFPEFDGFPKQYKYKNRLPILGSRGCIRRCVFCDDALTWDFYRARSAENIIEEMELRKKEGVEFLDFNDLLINGNLRQLSRLCDLIIKKGLDIPWGGSASINKHMDLAFFKKLKRSGCIYLNYGIESAAAKVLSAMNKGFSIQEAKKVIEDTYKAGIAVSTNWIVGFPNETEDDFKETLNFIQDNIYYFKNGVMINSFILKSNSPLYKNKEKFGIVMDSQGNWQSLAGLNTTAERKKRYDAFIKLLSNLGDRPSQEMFNK